MRIAAVTREGENVFVEWPFITLSPIIAFLSFTQRKKVIKLIFPPTAAHKWHNPIIFLFSYPEISSFTHTHTGLTKWPWSQSLYSKCLVRSKLKNPRRKGKIYFRTVDTLSTVKIHEYTYVMIPVDSAFLSFLSSNSYYSTHAWKFDLLLNQQC